MVNREAEVFANLESEFQKFRDEYALARRERLPRIEHLIYQVTMMNQDGYLAGKCTSFLDCCKEMSRLRQPRSYDESQCISFALGDLSGIRWVLIEGGPNASAT